MFRKQALIMLLLATLGACAQNPYVACRNAADRDYCLQAHMYERSKWNSLGAVGTNLYNQSQENYRARELSRGLSLSGQHNNHLYRYHSGGW